MASHTRTSLFEGERKEPLQNVEPNVQQLELDMHWTPLHTAARDGDIKRLRRCLQIPWAKKIDINSKTSSGHTPLHMGAANGHTEILQVLLSQDEVDKNPATNKGNTPLHLAALNAQGPACMMLIKNGAESSLKNLSGQTPADLCPSGAQDVKNFLLDAAENKGRFELAEV